MADRAAPVTAPAADYNGTGVRANHYRDAIKENRKNARRAAKKHTDFEPPGI